MKKQSLKYVKQSEEILHWFESSVGSVSVVIQGFFHMIVVDIVAIFHTYRQVILTLLLCGQSRMYSQVDLGAVQLTELSLGRYVCCHCLSLGRYAWCGLFLAQLSSALFSLLSWLLLHRGLSEEVKQLCSGLFCLNLCASFHLSAVGYSVFIITQALYFPILLCVFLFISILDFYTVMEWEDNVYMESRFLSCHLHILTLVTGQFCRIPDVVIQCWANV